MLLHGTEMKSPPSEMKSKVELNGREPTGHGLINGNSSNDLEELEEEDDSDSSSPPLPYLQAPPPDGCCTQDGKARGPRHPGDLLNISDVHRDIS